jgi:hypothetical protein
MLESLKLCCFLLLGTSAFLPKRSIVLKSSRFRKFQDVPLESISQSLSAIESFQSIIARAAEKALSGGSAGASAAALQVTSLMWLRTALNYQYKYGVTTSEALKTLYDQGGIARLYQGLPFAIIQGPLSRFGDTAANALVYSIVDSYDPTGLVPAYIRTAFSAIGAGGFRILLMPVDTAKTCMQVNGDEGLSLLSSRIKSEGLQTLFSGSLATCAATIVGHYPWFLTYNSLSSSLLTVEQIHSFADVHTLSHPDATTGFILFLASLDTRLLDIMRSAFIGLTASCASDICSNSLRYYAYLILIDMYMTILTCVEF